MRKLLITGTLLGVVAGLSACPSDPMSNNGDMSTTGGDGGMTNVLVGKRPSRSGTIAISDDGATVAMSNPDDGSVSFFKTADNSKLATAPTGAEPWAVVIHPDSTTAFVANRAAATVVKVTGINTASPTVGTAVNVGSEPTGLALSPTGAKLYVAEWGEGRVSVIDTASMAVVATITGLRNPRAVAVTNNGDTSDDDETLVVTEFFGKPVAGKEGQDDGRTGEVRLFSTRDNSSTGTITFNPLTALETGFTVGTSPNQLSAVAINGTKIYVPSVSASPAGPPTFNQNVAPVVYVGDLQGKVEQKTGAGTTNLAKLVSSDIPAAMPHFFLADLVDIDFVPGTNIAYAVSRGADVIQRIDYGGTQVAIGSSQNKQIDVTAMCQNPIGIAIKDTTRAYVNCWVSRKLGVLDLGGQSLSAAVDSSPAPGTGLPAQQQRGKRFFFTGRGRWSGNGTAATAPTGADIGSAWSSCGSCHPDGLTDNITWVFAAGPRQSTSLDGSYSKGATKKQRIFNWTAIIDEMHDFDANTRGTSGGVGAITTAAAQNTCGTLASETRVALAAQALDTPTSKENQDGTGMAGAIRCTKDFDDIDEWVKTVRPPRRRSGLDQASVTRGAALFTSGGCDRCHGGPGWTVSNRFYTPSTAQNNSLKNTVTFTKPAAWPTSYTFHNTTQVAVQPTTAEVAGYNVTPIGPLQLACAIRAVGTFGVPGDVTATDALESKPPGQGRAQGRGGYNVPSLYGLQVGAPYLHHGQAKTLEELFTDTKWQGHWQAGAANFLTGATANADRADLINYLLSIDGTSTEVTVPAGFAAGCLAN